MKTPVFESMGIAKTTQKITPGNAATGIGAEVYRYVERTLAYTSGGTTEIVAGDLIVGATSGAVATVVSLTLTGGTWAGGNAAGVLTIKNQVGTFQSEKIKVKAGTDDATIAGNSTVSTANYPFKKDALAKGVFIQNLDNDCLCCWDGTNPDQTSLVGITMATGDSFALPGTENVMRLKFIDKLSGSASSQRIVCYF